MKIATVKCDGCGQLLFVNYIPDPDEPTNPEPINMQVGLKGWTFSSTLPEHFCPTCMGETDTPTE